MTGRTPPSAEGWGWGGQWARICCREWNGGPQQQNTPVIAMAPEEQGAFSRAIVLSKLSGTCAAQCPHLTDVSLCTPASPALNMV